MKRPITEEERSRAEALGWRESRQLADKLAGLRLRLYVKAKQEPGFRFYSLFSQITRKDVLQAAWQMVLKNEGGPGIDGVTVHQIVKMEGGPDRLVEELREQLCSHSYAPQPVRRVYIPKPDGRERPLGIPTVRDRVVQAAVLLVLEAIFEADFHDCSYGFRPKRSAHGALSAVQEGIESGRREVYDADLRGYFDSIPHDKLMKAVRMRIVDGSVLKLIRMWLRAPVIDRRNGGRSERPRRGTPQGGVISPLLANVYLHWFDTFFHAPDGPGKWANARLLVRLSNRPVHPPPAGRQLSVFYGASLSACGTHRRASSLQVRHPRESGGPDPVKAAETPFSWIPACAGMPQGYFRVFVILFYPTANRGSHVKRYP